jgi:hypothetical protein
MIQGFSSGLIGNRELIYETDLPSFQRDFAALKTLDHGTGPAITFTRASGATYFDANGVLQTAADDAPRFDHDPVTGESRGLLIEEQRTNSLRNSQGGGSTVGTHTGGSGAGGVLPTNWIWSSGGLSLDVVGTGTEDGLSYIDIRFYGTVTASIAALGYEAQSHIVAANGQTWSASHYVRTVAGNLTNITEVETQIRLNNVSTAVDTENVAFTPSASYQRATATTTIADATVNRIVARLALAFSTGTIDITLRIAAPQLELGAFATSYIPTTTAAATRAAESAVVTPISSFYNQVEGTLFCDSFVRSPRLLSFDDDTQSNRVQFTSNIGAPQFLVDGGCTITAGSALGANGQQLRLAAAYKTNDFAVSRDGGTVETDTSGTVPVGLTHLRIGRSVASFWTNGHIRKIACWPKRLSDTLLEQITT